MLLSFRQALLFCVMWNNFSIKRKSHVLKTFTLLPTLFYVLHSFGDWGGGGRGFDLRPRKQG